MTTVTIDLRVAQLAHACLERSLLMSDRSAADVIGAALAAPQRAPPLRFSDILDNLPFRYAEEPMRPEVGHRYKAGDTPPAGLTVAELCRVNVLRCMTDFKHPLQAWSLFEWAGAVAGEAGEACNVAKKLIRFRNGLEFMNKRGDMPEREREELLHKLGKELADTVHYACLAFAAAGLDMEMYLIDVFNTVSDENGSKIKIPPSRPAKNTY